MTCAVCGQGPYVLIDGLCGECLLVANGEWPDAPPPAHEDVIDADGGSVKYLPGFYESWRHLHHVSAILTTARRHRDEARERPVAPVVIGKW